MLNADDTDRPRLATLIEQILQWADGPTDDKSPDDSNHVTKQARRKRASRRDVSPSLEREGNTDSAPDEKGGAP